MNWLHSLLGLARLFFSCKGLDGYYERRAASGVTACIKW
jgi:hypothetical protein